VWFTLRLILVRLF